jgi:hypothetical protein
VEPDGGAPPPNISLPSDKRLSASGIGIPPVPLPGTPWWAFETNAHRTTLMARQLDEHHWDDNNVATWELFFCHRWEFELSVHRCGLTPPP